MAATLSAGSRLTLSIGGGGGGGDGFTTDTTLTVGSPQYPTFADAWTAATSASIAPGATVTIQLPATGASKITDAFLNTGYFDKDFSSIVIKGATKTYGVATAISAVSGAAGAYSLTFTVPTQVATAAAANGFMLVETPIILTGTQNPNIIGYFRVTATTATTVTVEITSSATLTAPTFVTGAYICTVFNSIYKVSNANPFWKSVRSKSPVFQDVGVVGAYNDPGYAPDNNHCFVNIFSNSSFSSYNTDMQPVATDPLISIAAYGFTFGVQAIGAGTVLGPIAISGCTNNGFYINSGCNAYSQQLIVTNNCRTVSTSQVNVFASQLNHQGDFTARPFVISGGSQVGVNAVQGSMDLASLIINGNVGTNFTVNSNSLARTASAAFINIGTQSPAANTVGNNNSYIRNP